MSNSYTQAYSRVSSEFPCPLCGGYSRDGQSVRDLQLALQGDRIDLEPPLPAPIPGGAGADRSRQDGLSGHAPGPARSRCVRPARPGAEPVHTEPAPQLDSGPGAPEIPGEDPGRVRSLGLGALRDLCRQEQDSL